MSPEDPSPVQGRSVFVSGATGSFGNAFVRRCLRDGARRIVIFSRDELKQSSMRTALNDDPRLRFFIGDVRNESRLAWAVQGCDIVVHAAAMKRIGECEQNPAEAIATNVVGSCNVAEAAIRAAVSRCVMLSTDKAPAATTLYGATKFCAERLWCASNVYARGGATLLSAVRYGNVLGSRGSVLDVWKKQVQYGAPVTITDTRATRFWLTIEQAVDLVVLALREMRGGEVFIPHAPASPITHLVSAIAGATPYTLEMTGLRQAERLHETLIAPDEARYTYDCGTHYVIEPVERTWQDGVPPLRAPKVDPAFSFRSDTARQLSALELQEMLAA